MADPKIINEWLLKADEDYKFASTNLKEQNSFYAQICFHFHEAAEKYLKAYIIASELEFKRIHDLVQLLHICKEKESEFESLEDSCEFLNGFYVETRYPVHWPTNYNIDTAKKAQKECKHIGEFVKKYLKL